MQAFFKQLSYHELAALIAGCLLPFAFAPYGIYLLAIICPAVLLFTWQTCTPKQALWRGFTFGLGFFGFGASWVYISIHNFGNANIYLAGFITALFIIILAFFIGVQGYILARLFPRNSWLKSCLAFPSSWALMEWIRSWIFTGFPWLFLGASQVSSPLSGFAPIVGEFGLSFIVALNATLLVLIVGWIRCALHRNPPNNIIPPLQKGGWGDFIHPTLSIIIIAAIWIGGALLCQIDWTKPKGNTIKVALIQGDIPQQLKWTPDYLTSAIQTYVKLTQANWDKQLIVWPETAIPLLKRDAQPLLDQLDRQAKQHHSALITGIPVQNGFDYYNAAIAIGTGSGIYYKQHLVPFGEYTPFVDWFGKILNFLAIPMSDFRAGAAQQKLLQIPGAQVAMFICYEIAYSNLVLAELPQANLLITISDDAWFGHSFASAQHLQIGQMRALESGRYLLFSSNSGITAVIEPNGAIQSQLPAFIPAALSGQVIAMTGQTPYTYLGLVTIITMLLGVFIIAVIAEYIQGKRHTNIESST